MAGAGAGAVFRVVLGEAARDGAFGFLDETETETGSSACVKEEEEEMEGWGPCFVRTSESHCWRKDSSSESRSLLDAMGEL